jgi:hypothetical protein
LVAKSGFKRPLRAPPVSDGLLVRQFLLDLSRFDSRLGTRKKKLKV